MRRPFRSGASWGAATAVVVSAAAIAAELYVLSPRGAPLEMHPSYVAMFPIALCVPPFAVAFILFVPPGTRPLADAVVAFCLTYVAVGAGGIIAANEARIGAFAQLAQRSAPLVEAIHRFEDDHGRPPAVLEELVPRYLRAVPGTGMGAYPRYDYRANRQTLFEGTANPWILTVDASAGPFDWTTFVYYPNQRYPPEAERIGQWAFVPGD